MNNNLEHSIVHEIIFDKFSDCLYLITENRFQFVSGIRIGIYNTTRFHMLYKHFQKLVEEDLNHDLLRKAINKINSEELQKPQIKII